MSKKDVVEAVEKLVAPVVEKHQCELVEVAFVKERADWFLRIYIDKSGGVVIEDCQAISEAINPMLDSIQSLSESYILEVSSPDLDRPLKTARDFEKYRGIEVEVKLFKPLNGKKTFVGILEGLVENDITIRSKEELQTFDRAQVAWVKRVIKF